MFKFLSVLLLFFLVEDKINAGNDTTYIEKEKNNLLKFCPFSVFYGNPLLVYERSVEKKYSVSLGFGVIGPMSNLSESIFLKNNYIENLKGIVLLPEFKIYSHTFHGEKKSSYWGAFLRYSYTNRTFNDPLYYSYYGQNNHINYLNNISFSSKMSSQEFAIGATAGYQFILDKKTTFDFSLRGLIKYIDLIGQRKYNDELANDNLLVQKFNGVLLKDTFRVGIMGCFAIGYVF